MRTFEEDVQVYIRRVRRVIERAIAKYAMRLAMEEAFRVISVRLLRFHELADR